MRLTKSCLRRLIKEELLSLHESVSCRNENLDSLSEEEAKNAEVWLTGLRFTTIGHRPDQDGDGFRDCWVKLIEKHGLEAAQELYRKLLADAKSLTKGVFLWPELQKWLKDLGTEETVTVGFVLDMFYDDEFGYEPEWVNQGNQWSDAMEGVLARMDFVE